MGEKERERRRRCKKIPTPHGRFGLSSSSAFLFLSPTAHCPFFNPHAALWNAEAALVADLFEEGSETHRRENVVCHTSLSLSLSLSLSRFRVFSIFFQMSARATDVVKRVQIHAGGGAGRTRRKEKRGATKATDNVCSVTIDFFRCQSLSDSLSLSLSLFLFRVLLSSM